MALSPFSADDSYRMKLWSDAAKYPICVYELKKLNITYTYCINKIIDN